jgi:hypothetical protein
MTQLYLAVITLVSGVTVTATTSECLVWSRKLEQNQPQRIALETKWVTEIYEAARIQCQPLPQKYKVSAL